MIPMDTKNAIKSPPNFDMSCWHKPGGVSFGFFVNVVSGIPANSEITHFYFGKRYANRYRHHLPSVKVCGQP